MNCGGKFSHWTDWNQIETTWNPGIPTMCWQSLDYWRNSMFDMKHLTRLKKLDEKVPEAMKGFWAFDRAVFAEGALTGQQKQLIAVAVALTTQCPYCIELHTKAARDAGANEEQLAEAALVAAAIRAGGAVTHATHLFKD
jgi:AhpD family alkylhydroperoxidase